MKTVNPRWARIQELFNQAADMTLAERAGFLNIECKDDPVLRRELDELLAADAGPPSDIQSGIKASLLTQSISGAIDRTTRDRRSELIGQVIGAYRLTAVLGHGGAGTVYLGERSDRQYSAQVAVKIVENSLIHDEVAKRFTAERQILASLNHPHIARLLDAGEARTGQPYLVMEYVHGETIDRYCDSHKLTLKQRLQLFIKVCAAVQYAHQNLIVHRDLKPGNILVTPDGTPKLLDFGIAKLMDASAKAAAAAAEQALTRINDRVLTPEYASPEQILGQNVTTASDVYALGIVLYELLTGARPYQVHALSQLELERVICVIDPPRPSQLLERIGLKDPETPQLDIHAVATVRDSSPKRLIRGLTGDLDAIILRALRKEPEQRYRSIEQLVDDINRHLHQEPVEARQGNWLYYSKRFVRRNALGVASGATALVALISFTVALTVQNQRIAEQRDLATQQTAVATSVSEFMQNVFENSDPFTSLGKDVTAKELLDKAGSRIDDDENLRRLPEAKAELLQSIGRAYQRQNQGELAIRYLEDSLKLQRAMPNKSRDALPIALNYLGVAQRESGQLTAASQSLAEAKALLEADDLTKSTKYVQLLSDIGRLELKKSNPEKAQQVQEAALILAKQVYESSSPEIAVILSDLAQSYSWQSNLDAAISAAREASTINHTSLAETHPDRAYSDYVLGELLARQGKYDEAAPLVRQALTTQKLLFGNDNLTLANTLDTLAMIQQGQGKLDAAEESSREALKIANNAAGASSIDTIFLETALADLLIKRKQYPEAIRLATEAMSTLESTQQTDHQYMASAEYLRANALYASKHYTQAEPLLRANIARWQQNQSPAWRVARAQNLLGATLMETSKADEGKALLQASYQALQAKDSGASAEIIADAKANLLKHGIALQ